jgi:hypothetical protein
MKCAKSIISGPLAKLMNWSIETGIYPSKLKYAKIIPVYKSGEEDNPTNYRPISLLSNINRIFEKLMYNRLKTFIDKHNILRLLHMMNVRFSLLNMAQRILGVTLPNF